MLGSAAEIKSIAIPVIIACRGGDCSFAKPTDLPASYQESAFSRHLASCVELALEKPSSFYTSSSAAPADEGRAKQTKGGGNILNCSGKARGSPGSVLQPSWLLCVPLRCFTALAPAMLSAAAPAPFTFCGPVAGKSLQLSPPDYKLKESFSRWMCSFHHSLESLSPFNRTARGRVCTVYATPDAALNRLI